MSKALMIDICKGWELFQNLEQYNYGIWKACEGYTFTSEEYDLPNKKLSWWFDPRCVRDLAISHVYPKCLPIQHDSRLCLTLYAPNYFSLLLINTLFQEKGIIIEDQAGGMGRLLYYLRKLEFNSFNNIDNFTQLPQDLFEKLMQIGEVPYKLNNFECVPKILNLIGYTYFIKPIHPNTELVIVYNRPGLIKGENEQYQYANQSLENYTPMENKVHLAECKYGLAHAYCNKDKFEEFKRKLEKYRSE